MADRIDPQPEHEKDPTGEFRKDLHAVEALQRYFGASSNRPAAHARVVGPGEERTEVPEENSPYNPTDFLGLNAEIESLLNLPPEAAAAAPAAEAEGAQESWLLEESGEAPVAEEPDPAHELPRRPASSFVEPEGRKERTGRLAGPVLAAAAITAAVFTGWKLTTEDAPVLDTLIEAVGWKSDAPEGPDGPRQDAPLERWELRPDGSRVAAPVGSNDPIEVAPDTVPVEPEVAVADEPVVPAEEELVTETTEEALVAPDETTVEVLDDAFTPFGTELFGPDMPFPWPSTLASALTHRRWRSAAGEEIGTGTAESEPGTEPVALLDEGSSDPAGGPVAFAAAGTSFTLSAEAFGRWMLLGPDAVEVLGEITSPEEIAALDGELPAVEPGAELTDAASTEDPRTAYSMLRRARGVTPDHWWSEDVPTHLIGGPRETFTPEVGRVRVMTQSGEIFIGRLAWVGRRMICLEADPGSLALAGRDIRTIERMMEETRPKSLSPTNDIAGLPEVRVAVSGGHLFGRLLEQAGDRVTLLTKDGGRITVNSTSVELVRAERSLALITGRVSD